MTGTESRPAAVSDPQVSRRIFAATDSRSARSRLPAQYLSTARLFGLSHSHLFGFAVIYGFNALLLSLSGASERLKCLVIAGICWSGMFDVLSWWGIREVSENFEIVSIVSGSTAGLGWLVSTAIVLRDLWRCPR